MVAGEGVGATQVARPDESTFVLAGSEVDQAAVVSVWCLSGFSGKQPYIPQSTCAYHPVAENWTVLSADPGTAVPADGLICTAARYSGASPHPDIPDAAPAMASEPISWVERTPSLP